MTTIDNSLWEQFLLSPMYYIYWGIALISSLVFTIQTIMLFVGFDTDATGFRLERSDSSSSL